MIGVLLLLVAVAAVALGMLLADANEHIARWRAWAEYLEADNDNLRADLRKATQR